MQTIDQLAKEIGLNEDQKLKVEAYFSGLVIELLESIKQDNIQNFDETINTINPAPESTQS